MKDGRKKLQRKKKGKEGRRHESRKEKKKEKRKIKEARRGEEEKWREGENKRRVRNKEEKSIVIFQYTLNRLISQQLSVSPGI